MRFQAVRSSMRVLFTALFAILCAHSVPAQVPEGTIRGTITDGSGAVVTGAEVKATNEATNQVQTTTSTPSGEFVFPKLPAGSYAVEAIARGFQAFRAGKIV